MLYRAYVQSSNLMHCLTPPHTAAALTVLCYCSSTANTPDCACHKNSHPSTQAVRNAMLPNSMSLQKGGLPADSKPLQIPAAHLGKVRCVEVSLAHRCAIPRAVTLHTHAAYTGTSWHAATDCKLPAGSNMSAGSQASCCCCTCACNFLDLRRRRWLGLGLRSGTERRR